MVSIGFIFLYCCIALLFAVDVIFFPWGLLIGWYLLYTVMNCASIMNILAFVVPQGGSSGSSNRTKRSVQAHPPQTSNTSQDSSGDATVNAVADAAASAV